MAANRNDASIEPAHCTSGQLLTLPLALTSDTLLGTSPAKTSHVSMDLEAKRWDICWSFLELFFANLQSRDVAFSDMAMAADGDGGLHNARTRGTQSPRSEACCQEAGLSHPLRHTFG